MVNYESEMFLNRGTFSSEEVDVESGGVISLVGRGHSAATGPGAGRTMDGIG